MDSKHIEEQNTFKSLHDNNYTTGCRTNGWFTGHITAILKYQLITQIKLGALDRKLRFLNNSYLEYFNINNSKFNVICKLDNFKMRECKIININKQTNKIRIRGERGLNVGLAIFEIYTKM